MSIQRSRSKLAMLAGIVLNSALALTACGSDDDTESQVSVEPVATPDVDITYDISGDTQEVSIDGEINLDQPAAWIISEGDGEAIQEGDLLHILTANVDIDNEKILSHDFNLGGSTLQLTEDFATTNAQVYDTLISAPLGSDMAFYLPADTLGQDTPAYLNLISIEDRVPTHATGEPVATDELDDQLPAVTLDETTQAPSIETPDGDAPEELVVDVLKQGDGPKVQAGSYVTIHYRGIAWSDGEEFDASWGPDNTGAPAQFELQSLIAGWQEGLEGQQVGSQVIMSVPPQLGYGGSEGHDLQNETLVFVIDILHSADPMPTE